MSEIIVGEFELISPHMFSRVTRVCVLYVKAIMRAEAPIPLRANNVLIRHVYNKLDV